MFGTDALTVGENGHLVIDGADTVELAKQYGTPLYVMSESSVRENCRMFLESVEKNYGGQGMVCYASKALSCKEMYRIMKDMGMGIDVVSAGELYTALSVDFPPERICHHGNNKTKEELVLAIGKGVGFIVADNITELDLIEVLAKEAGRQVSVLLRIKPGIDAHTHDFIRTGQIDSKFGFALETGEAMEACKYAVNSPHIDLKGIHCHIGSQIFGTDPFAHAAEVMLSFMNDVKKATGREMEVLNLGGGFGIRYTDEDTPIPYVEYMEAVASELKAKAGELDYKLPFIIIEPGRSIAGPAGITLYTVGSVKHIPNIRTYVSIDGGMTDNVRFALYGSKYDILNAANANAPKTERVTLAGRSCESGDLVGENMPVQKLSPGDTVAVLATGAYNYSMSSNYNRVQKPAMVMVRDGESRVIIKRETLDDIIRNDI